MSFMDSYTSVVDGKVEFNIDNGHDQNLVNYCSNICQERCNAPFDINDPPGCDCEVSRLYYAMTKLAEWEHRGLSFKQYCRITTPTDLVPVGENGFACVKCGMAYEGKRPPEINYCPNCGVKVKR